MRHWRTMPLVTLLILCNLSFIQTSTASEVRGYFVDRPNFVDLSSGLTSSCALSDSGEVWCWGDNKNFQVTNKVNTFEASPVKHNLVEKAYSVAAGSQHSCAVVRNQRVVCWGANNWGQLGAALLPIEREKSAIPEYVQGLVGAIEVFAGRDHSCGLTFNKELYCWGSNSDGQLGKPPSMVGRVGATQLNEVADRIELKNVADVSLGNSHSCALDSDGFVYCWGSNIYGQLGRGWTRDDLYVPKVVPNLTKIVELDSGGDTTCARSSAGKMFCWGKGDVGQIGNSDSVSYAIPVEVNFGQLAGNLKNSLIVVESMSSGPASTCAKLKNNGVYCWGSFSFAQVGTENSPTLRSLNPAVLAQTGLNTVTALDSGLNFTCALHEQISCWGQNNLGQLGRGTTSIFGTTALIMNPTWDLSPNTISFSIKDNVVTIEWPVVGVSQKYARVVGRQDELLCQSAVLTKCEFFWSTGQDSQVTLYLTVLDGLSQARTTRAVVDITLDVLESAVSKERTVLRDAKAKEVFDEIQRQKDFEKLSLLNNILSRSEEAYALAYKEMEIKEEKNFIAIDRKNVSRDLASLKFDALSESITSMNSLFKEIGNLLRDLFSLKKRDKKGA